MKILRELLGSQSGMPRKYMLKRLFYFILFKIEINISKKPMLCWKHSLFT